MWLYYASISLAIIANIFYYLFQKFTPGNANPLLSLIVTYFTAMVTCILLLPFFPDGNSLAESLRKLSWTSIALGIAIVGLEMGFLMAFRSGWNISTAGVSANVVVALILIPVGLLIFKEHLKPSNIAGIILCIVGLFLIGKK